MTGLCPLVVVGSNPTAVMVCLIWRIRAVAGWWQYQGTGARGFNSHRVFSGRGVAQPAARLLWEQDAAGSNPVTPTMKGTYSNSQMMNDR